MARDDASRRALLSAMMRIAQDARLSSAHVLFLDAHDQQAARDVGWMMRSTVQFHWVNREPQPYADFAEFLASLQREKRKKIQQERRRVGEAGVSFTTHAGAGIDDESWDFFYRCYVRTYRAHHSSPYLTRDFLRAHGPPRCPRTGCCSSPGRTAQRVAVSLIGVDRARGAAYGRYWGATEHISCLHFEACYYQPLAWCIANGMQRFEGGAQGEHKMARGLLPVQTWSAHWLAHPQFAEAVAQFLEREGTAVDGYLDELNERLPFKQALLPSAE